MNRKMLFAVVAMGLGVSTTSWAAVINVSAGQSIQAAITSSSNGDEIVVAPGTYFETGINLLDRQIVLRSSGGPLVTIIDGGGVGSIILCQNGCGPNTTLDGFTLQNGIVSGQLGGGALTTSMSSLKVFNCIFIDNSADDGGAVYCFGGSPTFVNCLFARNEATSFNGQGGAIYHNFANSLILNCTFAENVASTGGPFYALTSVPRLFNCNLWDNTPNTVAGDLGAVITHSNLEPGYVGQGNVSIDPLFADAPGADFSLAAGSPIIDRGDSTAVAEDFFFDAVGNLRGVDDPATPDRGIAVFNITIDMGAFEFQVDCDAPNDCPADIDGNGEIGFDDLLNILLNWGPCP